VLPQFGGEAQHLGIEVNAPFQVVGDDLDMIDFLVLWYLPEYKIFIISTTYAHISLSQNIERVSSNAQDF
jgi:hypothetical protein